MEKDLFPERMKFWKKLKKDFSKWSHNEKFRNEHDEL